MRNNKLVFALVPFFVFLLFFLFSTPIQASILDDIKNIFSKEDAKIFRLTSDISLSPNGDIDNNGQITSGDIVRFSYVIINTTDKKYTYSILKTNVDRKQINFVHNLQGTTGLLDRYGTIVFRNLRIEANEQRTISFDARINYSEVDKLISTQPEFLTSDSKSINKASKKEIKANKLTKQQIEKRLENRGVVLNEGNIKKTKTEN